MSQQIYEHEKTSVTAFAGEWGRSYQITTQGGYVQLPRERAAEVAKAILRAEGWILTGGPSE